MRSETALRRGALGAFAAVIALTVAHIALSRGLAGRPGLVHSDVAEVDAVGVDESGTTASTSAT